MLRSYFLLLLFRVAEWKNVKIFQKGNKRGNVYCSLDFGLGSFNFNSKISLRLKRADPIKQSMSFFPSSIETTKHKKKRFVTIFYWWEIYWHDSAHDGWIDRRKNSLEKSMKKYWKNVKTIVIVWNRRAVWMNSVCTSHKQRIFIVLNSSFLWKCKMAKRSENKYSDEIAGIYLSIMLDL